MSAITQPVPSAGASPELHSGDTMSREEFHRIYSQMPEDFKAELIGGIVYVASPLEVRHSRSHVSLTIAFGMYAGFTPGVEAGDNATIFLDNDAEPQPDSYLRILPEFGGQSKTTDDDYVQGPPELLAEVAYSSKAIDLGPKLKDYTRSGVLEYFVVCLREKQIRWFNLRDNKELTPDSDGICKLINFPGLWIDSVALLANDAPRLLATLQRGLAKQEHADFVERLAAAKQ